MKGTAVINVAGVPKVSSLDVAKAFGKEHRNVLRGIEALDCSEKFSLLNFEQSHYINSRNKTIPIVHMTKDGFTFLVMGFTGKQAAQLKEAYIDAFNAMEKALLAKTDKLEWKQAREQLKLTRRSFTDAVKVFVQYATTQGSESATRYYANITKMEYAALELLEKGGKVPDGFRDTLDFTQIGYLTAAEQVARQALQYGMDASMHYKEIYVFAKQKVTQYADAIKMPQLNLKEVLE